MARPYAAGDTLLLREYDPARPQHYAEDRYTGRSLIVRVTYVSAGGTLTSFGLPDELCVMSIVVAGRLIGGDRRLPPTLPRDIDPVAT